MSRWLKHRAGEADRGWWWDGCGSLSRLTNSRAVWTARSSLRPWIRLSLSHSARSTTGSSRRCWRGLLLLLLLLLLVRCCLWSCLRSHRWRSGSSCRCCCHGLHDATASCATDASSWRFVPAGGTFETSHYASHCRCRGLTFVGVISSSSCSTANMAHLTLPQVSRLQTSNFTEKSYTFKKPKVLPFSKQSDGAQSGYVNYPISNTTWQGRVPGLTGKIRCLYLPPTYHCNVRITNLAPTFTRASQKELYTYVRHLKIGTGDTLTV